MHAEDIKAELRKKGYTLAAVADETQVSRSMVTHVINGHARSAHIQRRIAAIISREIDAIWPPKAKPKAAPGLRRPHPATARAAA